MFRKRRSLAEAVNAFIASRQAMNASPATIQGYAYQLRPFVDFVAESGKSWEEAETIESYLANLAARVAPATLDTAYRRIRTFYRWAHIRGYIKHDPTTEIKKPRIGNRGPKAIRHIDAITIITYVRENLDTWRDFRNLAILTVLYTTGIRANELCSLRIDHIDIQTRTIYIQAGKGDKSRTVVIPPITAKTISAYLSLRPTNKGPWLFVGSRGKMTPTGLRITIQRIAKAAGVSGRCNPHAWRHGYAREYLKNGGDIRTLADQLGHASIEITAKVYAVFLIHERREINDRAAPLTDSLPTPRSQLKLFD